MSINIHKIGGRAAFNTDKGYVAGEVVQNLFGSKSITTVLKLDNGEYFKAVRIMNNKPNR